MQQPDGSWPDVAEVHTGTTSLVTLALVTAGEKPNLPTVSAALEYLRRFRPKELRKTYAIALQTMVFATAEPARDQSRIAENVAWLERAQIRPGDPVNWPGSWTYDDAKHQNGDNSNTQYALLALHAGSEVGVPVKPEVWSLSHVYFERSQNGDGSWNYKPDETNSNSSASMTCAGIASLVMSGLPIRQGKELLQGDTVRNCGLEPSDRAVNSGLNWLARNFHVDQNPGPATQFSSGQYFKYHYLFCLERVGRLTGIRYFNTAKEHDWYRLGAEELVHKQNKLSGFWQGALVESDKTVATSFALMFLAKGRAPVLMHKLHHVPSNLRATKRPPSTDWDDDPHDVRNLVDIISRDKNTLLTWQVVDSRTATAAELLQAPILFFNGHRAPVFSLVEEKSLREFADQGGLILADACCGRTEFDKGFRELMKELFPAKGEELRVLPADHPIWKARHPLDSTVHPLWGIQRGGKTVVVYSPTDLSCYWNLSKSNPSNGAVIRAIKVGQNVIEYATDHKLPPDKLSIRSSSP
jgi:hypothetical protein